MMHYSFHAATDPGRVRTNNEDALVFDAGCGLAVLADGMGGYNAGEVASSMATQWVQKALLPCLSDVARQRQPAQAVTDIQRSVEQANLAILKAAKANPHYAGMGTTLVVGVFQDAQLVLGHVGDSRCYRLRQGVLTQITRDHSMLQERVDAGLMTPEQAARAPGRNLLTRAVGVEEILDVEIHVHAVLADDLYLMCSDGLTDMVSSSDIALVLGGNAPLPAMATELIARANAKGGRDNISVLLVRSVLPADKPGLISRLLHLVE